MDTPTPPRVATRRSFLPSPSRWNLGSRSVSRDLAAHQRNPGLDGLRGIAILLVLGAHAHLPLFQSGGVVGVTLFFVLSGFLITSILIRERDVTRTVSFRRFYLRRALRLLPALFVLVATALVASYAGVWGNSFSSTALGAISAITYVANWAALTTDSLGLLGHTWSLAVEEQFYVIWPLTFVVAIGLLGRRRLGLAVLCFALALAVERAVLAATGTSYLRLFSGTDTRGDALMLGCAVALLRLRAPRLAAISAALVLYVAVVALPDSTTAYLAYVLPGVGVASAVLVAADPVILGLAPLAYVGQMSYSLYLWHYLFIWSGLGPIAIIAFSFGAAWLSYRFVEQPFLRLKRRFEDPRPVRTEPAS